MTQGEIVVALRQQLKEESAIDFALLFGSWARGQAHPESDVDVAFMPLGDWTLAAELDLQGRLSHAVGAMVDLVRLDQAPPPLAWEIISVGIELIGEHSPLARYRAEVALEHAEMAPLLERAARHYARRIAELGVPR